MIRARARTRARARKDSSEKRPELHFYLINAIRTNNIQKICIDQNIWPA